MRRFFLVAVILLVASVVVLWLNHPGRTPEAAGDRFAPASNRPAVVVTESPTSGGNSSPAHELLGQTILRDYAAPNSTPERDLTDMAHLMENSLLLMKSAANRPLSANEDWAAFFRGSNSAHERFLPEGHVALNDQGQLVDRWRTPLFFHSIGGGRYEVRSAGPDKTMWTADDLHRNYDGSFRRGAALNPATLYDPAAKK